MKIRLRLDALQVQTFSTSEVPGAERGTVHARQLTLPRPQCYSNGTCVYPCTDTDPQTCAEATCAPTDYLPCCGG